MMNLPLLSQTIVVGKQRMDLFVPDAVAVKEAYEQGLTSFPYWSKVWPAAVAMSEFIEEYRDYVKDKNVLELGAGLGLPSLLAAHYAKHVLCTDYSDNAVNTFKQSVTHHGLLNVDAAVVDWHSLPSGLSADVLLLSDINYEPDGFATLTTIITSFLQRGTLVLLSTPQRLMAKTFVEPFLPLCVHQKEYTIKEKEGETAVTVMVLKASKT